MKTSDFIKRLDINYDIYALKKDWIKLRNKVNIHGPAWRQSISLTHAKNFNNGDIWHQIGGSKRYGNAPDDIINDELKNISPYLWYVCNDMKSKFDIGRIRIIITNPHTAYNIHYDYEVRWHVVIDAPRDSFTYFSLNENYVLDKDILNSAHGFGFHMPADGFVYEMNAVTLHTGVNCSESKQKIHLIFNALYKENSYENN